MVPDQGPTHLPGLCWWGGAGGQANDFILIQLIFSVIFPTNEFWVGASGGKSVFVWYQTKAPLTYLDYVDGVEQGGQANDFILIQLIFSVIFSTNEFWVGASGGKSVFLWYQTKAPLTYLDYVDGVEQGVRLMILF